jgi:hypothetical protein
LIKKKLKLKKHYKKTRSYRKKSRLSRFHKIKAFTFFFYFSEIFFCILILNCPREYWWCNFADSDWILVWLSIKRLI